MTIPDEHHPSACTAESRASVEEAIASRRSVRAFLPTPVSRQEVEEILRVASRAPSGTNAQPWKVYALSGQRRQELSAAILAVYNDPQAAAAHTEEYDYYPRQWVSPFLERRRKVGWDLYGLLGIKKGDQARMHAQHARNYEFFGAPVGLIFTIERVMGQGSLMDYGMFLQNIMIAARARRLDTCPQAAFLPFHRIIRRLLDIAEREMVVCGMALGYADPRAIENRLLTEREPVAGFAQFIGF